MDQSHDGTQPLEPVDTTQVVPAGDPQPATAPDAGTAGPAKAERPAAPASPEAVMPAEAATPAEPGRAAPAEAPPADQGRYAAPVTTSAPVAASAPARQRPRGPHAAAILLGVLAIAVAVLTILRETTDLTVNWSAFGPVSVIAAGVLLLLIGVVGLARRER